MKGRRCQILTCLGTILAAYPGARAAAYSVPEAFAAPAEIGGGGGRWFSGSPAEGFGCSACHTDVPNAAQFPLHVTGLPPRYQPSQSYDITLDWPEFTARWQQLRPDPLHATSLGPRPSIGLVAEFVAESGQASGSIEIESKDPSAEERCERVRANLLPRLAAELVQLRPALAPLAAQTDEAGKLHCQAHQLGQRCVVALRSCGAQRIRLRWTAPAQWQGPIWFAAGFVTSVAASGTAEHDSVYELAQPLLQANAPSERYVSRLSTTCSVLHANHPAPRHALFAFWIAVLCVWLARTILRGR